MNYDSRSLLEFLDTPVVVGDPDGRAVFANPAFREKFAGGARSITGASLSDFFGGGGREAVLRAVADVCREGKTVRFRLRDAGYRALASPITVDGAHVGVLILLNDESLEEERLRSLRREIRDCLDEVDHCLQTMVEQTGGRRAELHRESVEDGMRALTRLRKWSDDLLALSSGRGAAVDANATLDPLRCLRAAVARAKRLAGSAISLELLVPAQLPRVRGDEGRLEAALVRLLRERTKASPGCSLTFGAKAVEQGESASVLLTLVESPGSGGEPPPPVPLPELLREVVSSCGGTVRTTDDPVAGRMTAIALPAVAEP